MSDTIQQSTSTVLTDDAAALRVAAEIADRLAGGAVARDRDRVIPRDELELIAHSGLLGISVPADLGGAQVSNATLAEVQRVLAQADPSISQTLLPHYVLIGAIAGLAEPAFKARVLGDVLAGARIGNGLSERGTKHAWDPQTRLSRGDDGQLVLNGSKYYTTGALTSDWIGFSAKDDDGRVVLVIVPRDVEGLELTDEWTSFGQRTTISGPAVLTNVGVEPEQVLPLYLAFEGPVLAGAFDQLLHAAIDTGVARAALEDAGRYVRERSRPWFESSAEKATDEPEVVYRFGELGVKVNVAEAALRDAARTLDEVGAGELTDENTARASIAVASAKAFAGAVGVEVASALFELAGTSATDAAWGLDRHWRNVRTHSLHDPVRWKYRHVGAYVLNGTLPPRHPLI